SVVPRGQPLDGPDMGAAAAAEDEGPVRERGREREVLLVQGLLLDDGSLRIREREVGSVRHALAAVPPRARDANEAGGEDAAAGVALVVAAQGDGGQRPAVGAARAKTRHDESLL